MFGRREERTTDVRRDTLDTTARGGISGGALATGVVVAQGAMLLLTALVGAVLVSAGQITEGSPTAGIEGTVEMGIGVMIAMLLVQFLAYMWGGHTAARMARGAGLAHGLLVPLISLLLALAIGAVAAALQANAVLNVPFGTGRLPLEGNYELTWGIGAGIAALLAMFLGGALGGARGEHWHTRLERDAASEPVATRHDERVGDVRHERHDDDAEVHSGGLAGRDTTRDHDYDTGDVRSDRAARSDAREVDLREEHAGSARRDDRSV